MTKAASVQLRMGAFAFLLAMASAVVSTAHAAYTNFNNGASKANTSAEAAASTKSSDKKKKKKKTGYPSGKGS